MKKAILLVSYGAASRTIWEKSIGMLEKEIRIEYKEWDVFQAFTGRRIIEKWCEQDVSMMNEREVLAWLNAEGYRQVVVLPTHLINGSEFKRVYDAVMEYSGLFDSIVLGGTLLETKERRELVAQALSDETLGLEDEIFVFVGHGSDTGADEVYRKLEYDLNKHCKSRAIVETLENREQILQRVDTVKVKVIPLLLTAGKHALKDVVGAYENSVASMLLRAGLKVDVVEKGLGEYVSIRKVYLNQLRQLICEAVL